MHPIVLLSGWAIPSLFLQPLETALQELCITTTVPLPGVDGINMTQITWKTLTDYLHTKMPVTRVILIGWSFGGTLAIRYAAQYPHKIAGLITLATTPSFLQKTNHPYGIQATKFESFCSMFALRPEKALKTFALTCSNNNHQEIKRLTNLWRNSSMELDTLQALQIFLGHADVMPQLRQINSPVAHCFADADQLVPAQVHKTIIENLPHHLVSLTQGSHMFFLNNPQFVINQILYMYKQPKT